MTSIQDAATKTLADISHTLIKEDYVFVSGRKMTALLDTNVDEVIRFKQCWSSLERDNYMADGGTYRYRRYGQFTKLAAQREITLLPHEPYVQPAFINTLNGDVERHFSPLSDKFVTSDLLAKLLFMMSDIYDDALGTPVNWNIRLHPYRIIANSSQQGQPTPEGLHRDGVTFIASLMINRVNIAGGVTSITDAKGGFREQIMLDKTFDLVMADDEQTMHEVTPITPVCSEKCAYRDVLVIAFTRMED
ncbi:MULTISPECIES: 2OG-Fe dioxygenase family protein [Vibrio]|uniref:2OG-Fe dioxygenase family protein n=1 Tax=Vibrio TaxID=662 RepID=UPI002074BD2C|nr:MULTISPECIES: 2OG-Fe dioxygenase family protein [Vibrio]USD34933.1 2OG-Fe dioxygenase family protein [Vibrio sp. SCSIO 43186]USD47998.1 2OG-Fe dioxygenase family protein [Vibrio sp. SCSIO 43145]USD72057.1 2OG-Fe dioxygenase family protein [Vibrio sp. SCSIO 43139]USD97727.1 hypothetical protein CTT30_16815 [Vibrio coralliilyticus]